MLEADTPQSRDHLIGLLWGDGDDAKASKNLRQALFNLRKTIQDTDPENPILLMVSDTIQVDVKNPHVWLDTQVFEKLISDCEKHPHRRIETCTACANRLGQAAQIYRGSFLHGFNLKDADYFQDWLVSRREYFHQKMIGVLEHLAGYHQQRREYKTAIEYARRLISMDEWREESYVLLMRLLAISSQRSDALKLYQKCRDILQDEFGVEPQPETVQLYEEILNNQIPDGTSELMQNDLPSFGTTFIGRQKEFLQIVESLQTKDRRLVTVVGTGGVGKTRLAAQVGQDQLYFFKNGVFWIPLENIETPNALPDIIASAVGMELPAKGDVRLHVLNFLRHRDALLIFDNYEHLLPETGFVAEILNRSPGVSILITSRESLHLQVEWVFELKGLPLQVEEKEIELLPAAVLLLEQRAQRLNPQFRISTDDDYRDALHLCELLDGLPLGIELASGMLKKYTCAEIAEQILENIDTLASSLRDIPSRHRSLWVVFEHSWDLLSKEEKRAFAALGVFPSRFNAIAGYEICDTASGLLDDLCRKSLLRQLGRDMYGLHPLLQQYARKKQDSVGISEEELNKKFQTYYGVFAQKGEQDMKSERIQQALDIFSTEWVNLTTSWNMALAGSDIESLNTLLSPFFWFFEIKGKIYEGETLFQAALSMVETRKENDEKWRSFYYRLLIYYGWLSFRRGRTDRASQCLAQAVEQGFDTLIVSEQVFSTTHLGSIYYETGQKVKAHELHEKAMNLCAENQVLWEESLMCNHYGSMLSMDGDLDQAERILKQGAAIAESNQFTWIIASVLSNLAVLVYFQQDYQSAIELFLQSNEKSSLYGDFHRSPSVNHNNLAECYALIGQLDKASEHLKAALYHFKECGNIVFLPYVYNTLATIHLQSNKHSEARQALDDGIKSAVENQMQAVLNNLLVDYARYFLLSGQVKEAAAIIHFVNNSPHTIKEGEDKVVQLLNEYGEGLQKEVEALTDQSFTQQEVLDVTRL